MCDSVGPPFFYPAVPCCAARLMPYSGGDPAAIRMPTGAHSWGYSRMSGFPPPPSGPPTPPGPPVPPPPPAQYGSGAYAGGGEPPLDQPYYGAPFAAAFRRFWTKYATFSGRASRSEYWWWYLIGFIVNAVLSGLRNIHGPVGVIFGVIEGIWGLAIIVPTLALLWRRLHDTNRSGIWALAPIIFAVVGAILAAVGAVVAIAGAHGIGGVLLLVGGIVAIVGSIVLLIFTLQGPKPEGARFDR
ncbi:DUF805 domain-containing protein [Gryllotalpicola reticulitermitis]|uniref:DUF805 domain-containing protein n=1 Tax=Gryllotalpicola reticulitermitis TaxID=1184153 RepID=A0ABV8Q7B4_9MICO